MLSPDLHRAPRFDEPARLTADLFCGLMRTDVCLIFSKRLVTLTSWEHP